MADLPPIIRFARRLSRALLGDPVRCLGRACTMANGIFRQPPRRLPRARDNGLAVVLITNAPRPSADVVAQIASLGVPDGRLGPRRHLRRRDPRPDRRRPAQDLPYRPRPRLHAL